MIARIALLAFVSIVGAARAVDAHEVRPGYLELREHGRDDVDVLWKIPARGEFRLRLDVRLPTECIPTPPSGSFVGGAFVQRWSARCPGGLIGRTVSIEGLGATRTDVLVRVAVADGTSRIARLTPDRPSFTVDATPSTGAVARTYLMLGVEHILFGVDHVLFVLGLLLLVGNFRRLVATVTAFTLAHSVTLTAATLGWMHLAQAPVEATIALSVVFVATEIVHSGRGRRGLTARAPWIVAFAFGLLHGFGFAGALREVGLPSKDIPLALLCFNVGVEAGQLAFVAGILGLGLGFRALLVRRGGARRSAWPEDARIRTPIAYLIGSLAAFWLVERVSAFFE